MEKELLNFDIESIFLWARKGIIRAAYFTGIVLNPKNSIEVKQWNAMEEFINAPEPKDKNLAMDEFKLFVSKSALREMIEFFEKTLLGVFEMLNIIEKRPSSEELADIYKETKEFKGKNFPEKLEIIDRILNYKLSKRKDFWQALQNIRNCITHNASIVDKETITIIIPKFVAVIKGKTTGRETIIPFGYQEKAIKIEEESDLLLKIEQNHKTFKKGEVISFNNEEIALLIFGMQESLNIFRNIIIENTLKNKIPLKLLSTNKFVTTIEEFREIQKEQIEKQKESINK